MGPSRISATSASTSRPTRSRPRGARDGSPTTPVTRGQPPAGVAALQRRLVARDGLLAMRTQARNQRHALLQWPVVGAGVR